MWFHKMKSAVRVISGTVAAMAFEAAAPPQNNPRQRFRSEL